MLSGLLKILTARRVELNQPFHGGHGSGLLEHLPLMIIDGVTPSVVAVLADAVHRRGSDGSGGSVRTVPEGIVPP